MKKTLAAILAVFLVVFMFSGCQQGIASSKLNNKVFINEAMSSNSMYAPDCKGQYFDWIEIRNASDKDVDLAGCYLTDDEKTPQKYRFSSFVIPSGGYRILYLSGFDMTDEAGQVHAGFKLSAEGEKLTLSDSGGSRIDVFEMPKSDNNISYGIVSYQGQKTYGWFVQVTPGAENSSTSYDSPEKISVGESNVRINEYMSSNKFILYDEDGDYNDWVELYNTGSSDILLEGWSLTDDVSEPAKWKFPAGTSLKAGEYLVVFCSGKNKIDPAGTLHTNFSVGRDDSVLALYNPQNKECSKIELQQLPENISCGYDGGNELKLFARPTPGQANTSKAFVLTAAVSPDFNDGVLISEVLAISSNNEKDTYKSDFIEIYNSTSKPVNLKGYGLSQKLGELEYTFSDITLQANDYLIIYCDGKSKDLHAPFKIDAGGEDLYLYDASGKICDYFQTGKQLYSVSSGRRGNDTSKRVFFSQPTPGKANTVQSYQGYAQPPKMPTGGYVKSNTQISVAVPEGTYVTYTTDGTSPTENSARYNGAITITETMVVRVAAFREGYIRSSVVTETYFTETTHDLPVVSLSTKPEWLFGYESGIMVNGPGWTEEEPHLGANYWKDIERAVHVEYYDGGIKAAAFDAGAKIFGQFARSQKQKAFSLGMREKYGSSEITYPFFPYGKISSFGNLLLRPSGQDQARAKLRDELVPNIVRGRMDIDFQESQPCVLYINGEYWGLYYLREKLNGNYLQYKYGFEKGSFDLIKGQTFVTEGTYDAYREMTAYIRSHDLSQKEYYDYVCSKVDIDSLINFWITETFFGNADSGNVRCYKEKNGKWRWMLYDFDWAMDPTTWKNDFIKSYMLGSSGHGAGNSFDNSWIRRLLKNEEFKNKFISEYCRHLNTTFAPERTNAILDRMAGEIESEIARNCERWGYQTAGGWKNQVEFLRKFFNEKPEIAKKQLKANFGLSDKELNQYLKENK